MLKMALFDCASNEKCCSVNGGRGICPLFSSPPRGVWQLKSPHPRELAIQGKKNANARGSARGGAGRWWNWLMHKVTILPAHPAVTSGNISIQELKIIIDCTLTLFNYNNNNNNNNSNNKATTVMHIYVFTRKAEKNSEGFFEFLGLAPLLWK